MTSVAHFTCQWFNVMANQWKAGKEDEWTHLGSGKTFKTFYENPNMFPSITAQSGQ